MSRGFEDGANPGRTPTPDAGRGVPERRWSARHVTVAVIAGILVCAFLGVLLVA